MKLGRVRTLVTGARLGTLVETMTGGLVRYRVMFVEHERQPG